MNETLHTASMVAGLRALEGKREDPILVDPLAEALAGKNGIQAAQQAMAMKPTIGRNVCLRHRFFDDKLEAMLLSKEPLQLVLLGAGLDSRAVRFANFGGGNLRVVEVDYPAAVAEKQSRMREAQGALPGNCRYLGVDLSDKTTWAKLGEFLDRLPTLVIAEGLFCYLDETDFKNVLQKVAAISCSPLWFGFDTFSPEHKRPNNQDDGLKGLVEAKGEMLKGFFPARETGLWCRQAGWQMEDALSVDDFSRLVAGVPHPAPHFHLWFLRHQ